MSRGRELFAVDLGYRRVPVVEMPLDQLEGGKLGVYQPVSGEIWVAAQMPAIETYHTIWHELLHLLFHAGGLRDDDDEERTVSALANGLVELFVRNPDLPRLLNEVAHGGP